jgi:cob(I)alamin adenosyltransferase
MTEDVGEIHAAAVREGATSYADPVTGLLVMTELAHLKRGKCCGSQCRHCPYEWENVARRNPAKGEAPITTSTRRKHAVQYQGDLPTCSTAKPLRRKTTTKNVPYTRTGDQGSSQLSTGERRSKSDDVFVALGTVDELNSHTGLACAQLRESDDRRDYGLLPEALLDVMSRLLDVGSIIAEVRPSDDKEHKAEDGAQEDGHLSLLTESVAQLEEWIDEMTDPMPELTSFLLPTGSVAAAQLHVARTVCRRAERSVVAAGSPGQVQQYLNRLSDFYFTAARYVNYCEGHDEIRYQSVNERQRQRVVVSLDSSDKKQPNGTEDSKVSS